MNAFTKAALSLALGIMTIGCGREAPTAVAAAGIVDGTVLNVRTVSGGRLVEWNARPGAEVRKEQVLGRMDPVRIENALNELALAEREITLAEARSRGQMPALRVKAEYVKRQIERLDRLKADQAAAGEEVEKAKVELAAAEAALADLRDSLSSQAIQKDKLAAKRRALDLEKDDLILKSPADGIILESHVSAGEFVPPGVTAAEILDTSDLRVDVYIEEAELSRLRLGDQAAVRVDGQEGREWSGTIVRFGSTAEFSPRYTLSEKERRAVLYKVTLRLEHDPAVFKLGMPVTVLFRR